MRSRKELIYLNIKDLTEAEKEKLSDYELNCCDKCGEIDLSINLLWIEGADSEDFYDDETAIALLAEGNVAVCKDCFDKEKSKKIPDN